MSKLIIKDADSITVTIRRGSETFEHVLHQPAIAVDATVETRDVTPEGALWSELEATGWVTLVLHLHGATKRQDQQQSSSRYA